MKTLLFSVLVLLVLSCGKPSDRLSMDAVTTLDTLDIKIFLMDPVDSTGMKAFERNCFVVDTTGLVLPRIEYKCWYIIDQDTVVNMTTSVYKTDSTWMFGTNGFKVEKFECSDDRVTLKYGLRVGSEIADFEKYFGQMRNDQDLYFTEFKFTSTELFLLVENGRVRKILITAANTRYVPLRGVV